MREYRGLRWLGISDRIEVMSETVGGYLDQVCVFMYVCVHACMNLCMYVCGYACIHVCMSAVVWDIRQNRGDERDCWRLP